MNWHRLFGLLLSDFFAGSPFVVELEKDLSMKKQLLDVVILRKGRGQFAGRLPDGLDNLAAHNLMTFKSYQEALDDWALKEHAEVAVAGGRVSAVCCMYQVSAQPGRCGG